MLADKIVFITGSTKGIGWETAREFSRHGATVILNHRNGGSILDEKCHKLEEEFGRPAHGIAGDMASSDDVRKCYAEIFRRFKGLDVLVNNAGILRDALLGMIPDATIHDVINTNLVGSLLNLQEASRLMTRRGRGSVVNISSVIGRFGNEGQAVYAASKAAVIGLTLAAAKELAPKNIRVNAVAPGFIDTDMTKQLAPDKYKKRLEGIKMGRIGTPGEVANVIVFLASDLSSYVTGQVIGVDGGMIV
jgi:3-oxoacyl-[acyl-carrier protein] reductase